MFADALPEIPDIQVNFHHDYHFEVTRVHVSVISPEMRAAAVSISPPKHSPSLALGTAFLACPFVQNPTPLAEHFW